MSLPYNNEIRPGLQVLKNYLPVSTVKCLKNRRFIIHFLFMRWGFLVILFNIINNINGRKLKQLG